MKQPALAVAYLLAAISFATAQDHGAPPPTTVPYHGCAIQIVRVDWMDQYKTCIDKIADLGGDTVELVVNSRQEDGHSSQIFLDLRMTPTADQLGGLIDHAKAKKLRVILDPIVLLQDPKGNQWRGNMTPDDWATWFDSYREMLSYFAFIARDHHVDVFSVGSELVSAEDQLDEWTKTIKAVRDIYKGQLTYAANWDHYANIPFWDQLDLIAMNSFWKLGKEHNPTDDEIDASWQRIHGEVTAFSQKIGKPLLFTEVGWCSIGNAANEPWNYTKPESQTPTDNDLQKRLYAAFFKTWRGDPNLGGVMIWELVPGDASSYDDKRGYTPQNKPAEKVLRDYFANPDKPSGNKSR